MSSSFSGSVLDSIRMYKVEYAEEDGFPGFLSVARAE